MIFFVNIVQGRRYRVSGGVDDMQGIRARQRLFKKYNPKTIARMILLLDKVVSPGKVQDVRGVEAALNKWVD